MPKILVIDDEITIRTEVIEWLRLEGFEAFGAEDGKVGLRLIDQYLPDLIICDVMMPHVNGYEVLKALRANPSTMTIPFIFLSARATDNDISHGTDLGANGYITKPFSLIDFLQTVRELLQNTSAAGTIPAG
jgi:DNA-binding response OmpR family regulator